MHFREMDYGRMTITSLFKVPIKEWCTGRHVEHDNDKIFM